MRAKACGGERGREPAQTKVAPVWNQDRRLGQVILGGNGVQRPVIDVLVHRHYGGGTSGDPVGGEIAVFLSANSLWTSFGNRYSR